MNRNIEIEFVEEALVEIPAVTKLAHDGQAGLGGRREFWIGWQLFGAE